MPQVKVAWDGTNGVSVRGRTDKISDGGEAVGVGFRDGLRLPNMVGWCNSDVKFAAPTDLAVEDVEAESSSQWSCWPEKKILTEDLSTNSTWHCGCARWWQSWIFCLFVFIFFCCSTYHHPKPVRGNYHSHQISLRGLLVRSLWHFAYTKKILSPNTPTLPCSLFNFCSTWFHNNASSWWKYCRLSTPTSKNMSKKCKDSPRYQCKEGSEQSLWSWTHRKH